MTRKPGIKWTRDELRFKKDFLARTAKIHAGANGDRLNAAQEQAKTALALHFNPRTRTAYPSLARLAEKINRSRRQAIRVTQSLREAGIIDIVQPGSATLHCANVYVFPCLPEFLPDGYSAKNVTRGASDTFPKNVTTELVTSKAGASDARVTRLVSCTSPNVGIEVRHVGKNQIQLPVLIAELPAATIRKLERALEVARWLVEQYPEIDCNQNRTAAAVDAITDEFLATYQRDFNEEHGGIAPCVG